VVVGTSAPKPDTNKLQRRRRHAYAAEATGLLMIGIVLLSLTLARYWSYIHWNIR
jgi:hypothetical protein